MASNLEVLIIIQTAPVHAKDWTPSGPWLRLSEILSIKIMNRTGDKGQPCQSPTCTGNRSDLLPGNAEPSSCSGRSTETEQPWTPYSRSTPTEYHEGHKAHVDWLGKTPINPQAPCGEYRAGPVFHDRDENRIVPPESKGRLSAEFSSPVPWFRPSRGG
ncbi:hypothetical protein L3Q82_017563 [Scortum barcoo]|uniref:Uncharacterized protein n=1 Tax=Scortum barcoo TaxID=214431 RepID=A0ACB8VKZ1_9TELE|nr:hypothetical protein L3Q82_017563 [Scortum barcoo]